MNLPGANAELGAQPVVDVRPVDDRLVVADGPEVLREDLNAGAKVGAELLRHVEPGLEELEAAALGVSEVVVAGRQHRALAHPAMDLERVGAAVVLGLTPRRFRCRSTQRRARARVQACRRRWRGGGGSVAACILRLRFARLGGVRKRGLRETGCRHAQWSLHQAISFSVVGFPSHTSARRTRSSQSAGRLPSTSASSSGSCRAARCRAARRTSAVAQHDAACGRAKRFRQARGGRVRAECTARALDVDDEPHAVRPVQSGR